MPKRRSWLAVLTLFLLVLGPARAFAFSIDDFEVGLNTILTCSETTLSGSSNAACSLEQNNLPQTNVVGGIRITDFLFGFTGPPPVVENVGASFGEISGEGLVNLTLVQAATATLRYLPSNLDLTAGGTLDRIEVDLFSVTLPSASNGTLQIALTDDQSNGDTVSVDFTSAGTYQFPFSAFSGDVDLTSISMIRLRNVAADAAGVSAWRVSEIRVIPEPATAVLLALGLAGLAVAGGRTVIG
jgi:hypothetical protein